MDTIREQLENPLVAGIVGFIVGALFGLVVLGWWLFPVSWENAAPANLHPGYQEVYLRNAIAAFAADNDVAQAQARWKELGPAATAALEKIKAQPGNLNPSAITAFEQVAAAASQGQQPAEGGGGGGLGSLLPLLCLLVVVLGAAFGGVYFLRQRRGGETGDRPLTAAQQAQKATEQAEATDFAALGEEAPVAQFMTTYMLGDDLFDDSFSIDSPSGEFLGECGVGISESIGVGDPKRVTAFEVWLFDKNDIQTVTRVVMSQHAFNDEDLRQRLSAKGEPALAEPGSQVMLETATLRMMARVVDMAYGEGALPDESYFERMTIELAIWQKEA
ncbi:MAG: hypothetical protein D6755_00810 [Anaerolineae bacterium]|nr:MAG: hypothetical protein D6755_00810 [Anaerolineae bacterium]